MLLKVLWFTSEWKTSRTIEFQTCMYIQYVKVLLTEVFVLPGLWRWSQWLGWLPSAINNGRSFSSKILTTRAPPSWIEFDVVMSHRQTRHLEYGLWLLISMFCVYWFLVKARKIIWEFQVIYSSSITQSEALWVWRCDVTTSNSTQDGGALVVNIWVFDLRVQLQHCTYQRKNLTFCFNQG